MADKKPMVNFDQMDEPINVRWITQPGIYRGMKVTKMEWKAATDKLSASFEVTFENKEGEVFVHRYWEVSTDPDKVKWVGKVYENGVEKRDRTKEEQIQENLNSYSYWLIQLGMAMGAEFSNVKRILSGATQDDDVFKNMFDAFRKAFFDEKKVADRLIDVKILVANNKKKKTSYMGIPDAGYRSVVFVRHDPKSPKSELSLSKYEQENCMSFMFKKPAPKSNDSELEDNDSGSGDDYQSEAAAPAAGGGNKPNADDDLF